MLESIGTQNVERMVQFRVTPGADLLAAIEEAVKREGIKAGVIVSGLGALKKAIFRNLKSFPKTYPATAQNRLYLEVEKPLELVSLVGWIATKIDGGIEIHAHFSASTVENDRVITLGGHLTEGTICGIKVVVAVLAVAGDKVYAAQEQETKTADIFFKK